MIFFVKNYDILSVFNNIDDTFLWLIKFFICNFNIQYVEL